MSRDMAEDDGSGSLEAFIPVVVLLLKNFVDSLVDLDECLTTSLEDSSSQNHTFRVHAALFDMNTIIALVLYDFRLSQTRTILDNELGYWVCPRSTAWFS